MLSRCDHKLGQTLILQANVKRTLHKFTFFLTNFSFTFLLIQGQYYVQKQI